MPPTPENVLGVLSLIFWALIVVISVKYLLFVMRADNRGEGGILALMALVHAAAQGQRGARARPVAGDAGPLRRGAAVRGRAHHAGHLGARRGGGPEVATPVFEPYIIPITLVILVGLFLVQRHGTAGIGIVFGPVMCLWFLALAVLGVKEMLHNPAVLWALSPVHGGALLLEQRHARLPGAGRRLPGGDGRRGALRGHGPLRPRGPSAGRGSRWCCRR